MPVVEKKPGRFVEADLNTLADGSFKKAIEKLLRRAVDELEKFEKETGELGGKVNFGIKGGVSRGKHEEYLELTYSTDLKLPNAKADVLVRAAKGILLTDPNDGEGSINDSDQMRLPTFDRFGNRGADVNIETGEVVEPDTEVAGTISKQA